MSFRWKAPKVLTLLCLVSLLLLPSAWGFEPLVLDDGTAEYGIARGENHMLCLNRFTPETEGYLLAEVAFQLYMALDTPPAVSCDVFVWGDDNSDPADGATLLASVRNITSSPASQWTTVQLDSPVWIESGRDILLGIFLPHNYFSFNSSFSLDTDTPQHRSYLAAFADGSFADNPTLPLDSPAYPLEPVDTIISGNFLIRGLPGNVASNPSPANEAAEVSSDISLSWEISDATPACDLFFGKSGDMALAATDLTSPDLAWTPGNLEPHVLYQWQVIGHTASSDISGDVWCFTTTFEPEIEEAQLEDFVLASAAYSGALSPDIYVVLNESGAGRVDLAPVEGVLTGVSFDIECLTEVSEDQMAVLPLTVTFRLTSSDLGQDLYDRIGEEASADSTLLDEALLENLIFTKIFPDGTAHDLFDLALETASGDAYEFFAASADEAGYTMTLDLAVVDGEATSGDAAVQAITDSDDHFFLIFDGQKDGRFSDPLTVTETQKGSGSSGNCNVGFSPAFALLFLPLLTLLKKR